MPRSSRCCLPLSCSQLLTFSSKDVEPAVKVVCDAMQSQMSLASTLFTSDAEKALNAQINTEIALVRRSAEACIQ